MRDRPRVVAVVLLVLGLAAAGCTGGGRAARPAAGASAGAGQRLGWGACAAPDAGAEGATLRPDAQCAWLTVPVDYGAPDKGTVRIRLARVQAADPARRLGSLVFNPGGPGEAGAAMVAGGVFEPTGPVLDRYDLVGFDPRGTGRSAPIRCPEGTGGDLIPRTPEQADAEYRAAAAQGEECRRAAGPLLAHMDSVTVARDLDLLRAALGESRLTYLGYSYGTYIGQHYAHLFPGRVGRFVLDGVVDPGADQVTTARADLVSLGASFASFARACAAAGCPLGRSEAEITRRTTDFVRGLDAHPLPGPEGSRLTTGLAVQGVREPLYQAARWPDLSQALLEAMRGRPGGLIELAVERTSRLGGGAPGAGEPAVDPTMARNAVECLDRPGPRGPGALLPLIQEFDRASPLFGATVGAGLFRCAAWPFGPTGRAEPLGAPQALAMLLVSWTTDPATPLANAERVRRTLGTASLVERAGTGHTAYAGGSPCTDAAVEAFLVEGRQPAQRVHCPA
ncbi:alpha/beta hydrolase [Streptomyces mashuensis]|uniref:Alpha/beta hydrolase n=1 Tax=Streptomyces mashuensis TaxID=33904 RepID=A0A919B5V5_9ACTN|nr:alpha/beta hydrolase [Streptomyces mashuensis]GHF59256.1 alpha/beta hydrolase [Streptomyces mashuensis]